MIGKGNKMNLKNIYLLSLPVLAAVLLSGCVKEQKVALKPTVAPVQAPIIVAAPEPVNTVSVTGSAEALKRLTVGGAHERVLSLSPDEKWLLIETYKERDSNRIIQKMKLSNGLKMLLTPDSSSSRYAVWHPNQNSFIFTTNRMQHYSIVQSMGVNGGSGVRFITKSSLGDAMYPDITSDGEKVVFSVDGNLAMVQPNGMDLVLFGSGYRPKFSPNNKKILFIQSVGDYRHIYTMNTDGQELVQLTSEPVNDYAANWSPSGKQIAFVSNRVGGYSHLFIMDADGSNITQLTDGQFNIRSLEWGNDGYIYFSADAGGNEDVWRLKPKRN